MCVFVCVCVCVSFVCNMFICFTLCLCVFFVHCVQLFYTLASLVCVCIVSYCFTHSLRSYVCRMSTIIAEYLDDSDPTTPKHGDCELRLRSKLSRLGVVTFLSRLRETNPELHSRLETTVSTVVSVDRGMVESLQNDVCGVSKRMKKSSLFHGQTWLSLSRFIPVRLSVDERRILAVLDRTLKVSEYTDNVDIYMSKYNRMETVRVETEKFVSVLTGQFVAQRMSKSTESFNDEWVGKCCEVGRRYKAMNPDRLRETHVKLMHMLQDSKHFSSNVNIITVASVVGDFCEEFLTDSSIIDEFLRNPKGLNLHHTIARYPNVDVELVLNSIADYVLLINGMIDPVNTVLNLLETLFVSGDSPLTNLCIKSGIGGARLNHSHSKQFQFVSQSLRLWREVLTYFMPLWLKAEEDLLTGDYRLADTGQGLNRVQSAPRAARLMNSIVDKVQRALDGSAWIGSSVVHMGDHNVPNALIFLDKYCQIPRILGPIAHTLNHLQKEYDQAPLCVRTYIDETFGGVEDAKKLILQDFFKHAFDGSGADNFYDAGSCIDGRLTSAWNWCSKIEKKSYFPLFLLTNFVGFDG